MNKNNVESLIIKFCAFSIGSISTFILYNDFQLSAVLASSLVGFIGSFAKPIKKIDISLVIYCGSFAGMCSSSVIHNYYEMLIISFVGASLYLLLRNHFTGVGGKLGATAFTSVALFVIGRSLF